MRLPAMGFTLPWQLVAAQEPGPMYLIGSGVSADEEAEAEQKKSGMARTSASQRRVNLEWVLIRGKSEKFCTLISFESRGSQPIRNCAGGLVSDCALIQGQEWFDSVGLCLLLIFLAIARMKWANSNKTIKTAKQSANLIGHSRIFCT